MEMSPDTVISIVIIAIAFVIGRRAPRWMAGVPFSPPEEAKRIADDPNAVIIDLRSNSQFGKAPGKIKDSINMPLIDLMGQMRRIKADLPVHQNVPVLLVCPAGRLSARAARMLRRGGLNKVHILDGGLRAWARARLPLEPPGK